MPKNVGSYQQGNITTMAPFGETDMDPDDMPTRAAPAGPVPRNQVPTRDNGHTVGNNDAHKV